jgi:hypothetical protein
MTTASVRPKFVIRAARLMDRAAPVTSRTEGWWLFSPVTNRWHWSPSWGEAIARMDAQIAGDVAWPRP